MELKDGRVVSEAEYSKSDEQLWEEVDDIFYKYDLNMDTLMN